MEQALLTNAAYLCNVLQIVVWPIILFPFAIVLLYDFHRFTVSDYPFGIFKFPLCSLMNVLRDSLCYIFVFLCSVCRSLFVFLSVSFCHCIVCLSSTSDYSFGIFIPFSQSLSVESSKGVFSDLPCSRMSEKGSK